MAAFVLLPPISLHTPLYADAREPASWVMVHGGGIKGALGEQVPLAGQDALLADGRLAWQAGLAAGVSMGFEPGDELTFNLITFDGTFGLPVDLALGPWRGRLVWAHTSAHFADGLRQASDVRPDPEEAQVYSREWLGVQLSHRWEGLEPYLAARYVYHSVEGATGPGLQVGCSYEQEGRVGPYFAGDLRAAAETTWAPTVALQGGVQLRGGSGAELRLGGVVHRGQSDAGRLYLQTETYAGVVLGATARRHKEPVKE